MFTAIKRCFSIEEINTGRQPELDIAKGFAILFMIWTHVFEELTPNSEGILVTIVRNILGGPFAAPVFMICLGIGVSYSKKSTPRNLLRRGFALLGIGLLLNVFRYVFPNLIKYALSNEIIYLEATFSLFSVDILQFAGLAFIFFALAKKMKFNYLKILVIGVFTSVLGTILRRVSIGDYVADQFVGFLWGTDTETYFPFLNWIIFPIIGLIFGSFLKHLKDKRFFYMLITPICGGFMIVYLLLTIQFGFMFTSSGSYYFLGLLDAIFFIILALMIFGINYAILQMFPRVSFRSLMRWSKNITAIYCIHWVVLGFTGIFWQLLIKSSTMNFYQSTLIAIMLLIVSDRVAVYYFDRIKPKLIKLTKQGG